MASNQPHDERNVERADRVLVWLTLVTLLLGGVVTLLVVFLTDFILSNM